MVAEDGPLVYLVAGEPSGDLLGARLMAALAELSQGRARVAGLGGEAMAAAGLASLFPTAELAVMGLAEVLPHAPRLLRRIRETADDIARRRPDVLVTIDSPGFTLRVARRLRAAFRAGRLAPFPLVHYVAPSVWAWRPGRAKTLAGIVDHVMTLLPFEPPYFERVGLAATFVGHPAVEQAAGDGPAFRARHGITPAATLLAVLPGSRMGEVTRLLPVFRETVARLSQRHGRLTVAIPTVETVAGAVAGAAVGWPVRTVVVHGGRERAGAFAAADAALAASGTVSLELSLAGVPQVVAYRMNPLTSWLARRLVKLEWVSLPNILLRRPVVPELLLGECRPERLAPALGRLLEEEGARADQRAAGGEVRRLLGGDGPPPSRRAAALVLDLADRARRGSAGGPAAL